MPFLSSALTNSVARGEIGLVGGNDVAARIAHFGIVQDLVVELDGSARPPSPPPEHRRRRIAAGAASATAAASATSAAACRSCRFQRRDALGSDGPVIAGCRCSMEFMPMRQMLNRNVSR